MSSWSRIAACCLALATAVLVPTAAWSKPPFTRVATLRGGPAPEFGMARVGNGALHLVYPTYAGARVTGLASTSIGPTGAVASPVQALSGWEAGLPGLVALANGTLEAVFGAISPGNASSVWGIASTDGGATWSAPADVRSGPNEALAYGSDLTAVLAGGAPVLSLPQAGSLVVQRGLGPGMPTAQVNDGAHGSLGNVNTAVDAATGEAVASWQSLNANGVVMQGISPAGPPQLVPGQLRTAMVIAGRDTGPGVFGAYTPDGTHVSLVRYGGGSVAVGSRAGVTAKVLGVATGPGGRIWVMWGDDDHGVAVTRSNTAVTRFEPIQHVDPHSSILWRLAGDGRLGPLDLLADATPAFTGSVPPPELDYARVLPLLTGATSVTAIKNSQGVVVAHKLVVKVTDAGDPVVGALVSCKGAKAKTGISGVAKLTIPGSPGRVSVTVTAPTYQTLVLQAAL